jgi:hypothetical protein
LYASRERRRTWKAESWTDAPEVSDGYAAARDVIKRHVERVIERLLNR